MNKREAVWLVVSFILGGFSVYFLLFNSSEIKNEISK